MPGIALNGDPYYGRTADVGNPYTSKDDMYGYGRGDYGRDARPGSDYGHYGGQRSDYRPSSDYGGQADYRHNGYSPGLPHAEEENSQFTLDHLATFSVGSNLGILFPEDGIKKLRMMEGSSGIWTMRVQLTIENKHINIVDTSNGEEIERFPLQLVQDPKAVMTNDRKDLFNNLLIFSVSEGDKRTGQTEMHIFQCVSKSAQDAVDDIVSSKFGRSRPSGPHHRIPPPPMEHAPMPPTNGAIHVRDQVSHLEHQRTQAHVHEDDLDSNASGDRVDKEVQLLNHCFDDIEKFVNRLQMAAEAFKSLQSRQKERKPRKQQHSRYMGEGLLTMRSRPPPPQDFMNIFAKFKLSFNLLAKLKAHIRDPNAPELVHFLFTPLSLIVEASKDNARYEYTNIASKVVSPLLSPEAKHLLLNCLTSRETDLWMSLGDSWNITRDIWKGYVPPYVPRFMDGWQPTPSIVDESHVDAISAAVNNHAAQIRRQEEASRAVGQAEEHVFRYERNQRPEFGNTVYREEMRREQEPMYSPRDSVPPSIGGPDPRNRAAHVSPNMSWEEEQEGFFRELKSRMARIAEVIHERSGNNPKELTIRRGELLEILDSSRNWWKMKNSRGTMGHAPYTMLKDITNEIDERNVASSPRGGYDAYDGGLSRDRPSSGNYNHSLPPPPPPAPLPPPPMQQPQPSVYRNGARRGEELAKKQQEKRKSAGGGSNGNAAVDDLQSELKNHLSMNSSRNGPLNMRPRSLTMYITTHSTTEEVKDWLISKSFNQRVIYDFERKNGADMFELTRGQMERICGIDEGQRLYSQITVQKNLSGYSAKGAFELESILHRRKKRVDSNSDVHNVPHTSNTSQPAPAPASPQGGGYYGAPPDYEPEEMSDDSSEYTAPGGSNTLKAMLKKRRKEILK